MIPEVVRRRLLHAWRSCAAVLQHCRGLGFLLAIQLVVSGVFVVWLTTTFHFGKRVVVTHLLLVASGLLLLLLGLGLGRRLCRRMSRAAARTTITIVLATQLTLLLLLYIGDAASNVYWKDNRTFGLFSYYLVRLPSLHQLLPVSGRRGSTGCSAPSWCSRYRFIGGSPPGFSLTSTGCSWGVDGGPAV